MSAYFFARPVLRGQTLQTNRDLLSSLESADADVKKLITQASSILTERDHLDQPSTRRQNFLGIIFLVVSFALFTGALYLQIYTDPSFVRQP